PAQPGCHRETRSLPSHLGGAAHVCNSSPLLVGAAEQARGYFYPKRLPCLEVDHKLETVRLLDWQRGGPGALDDLVVALPHGRSLHARRRKAPRTKSATRTPGASRSHPIPWD